MARSWDLRLEKNGISRMAYRELVYFCLQYGEKREKAETEGSAPKRGNLLRDTAMIEEAAREAAPAFCGELLRNVTAGTPYGKLKVPCGRRQFYDVRRKFFIILSQKRMKK